MQAIAALLLICLANVAISSNTPVCTNGFWLINNKCLKLFTIEANHQDAEISCKQFGATLVTIKNPQDIVAISTIAGSAKLIWLGLSCFEDSFGKCFWDDASGSANSYNCFSGGYPNVKVGQCVYYSHHGTLAGYWISEDCDRHRMPYICELPTTFEDNCDYNYNGSCYTFSSTAVPFATAQKICELSCGNLVSIHSPNEVRYLDTFADWQQGDYFIGATWKNNYSLSWLDDSAWDYDNIDSSWPVQVGHCFTMFHAYGSDNFRGSWYTVNNCEEAQQYICKRPAGVPCSPVPPVTPTPNPSNCNGPRMMYSGFFTSPNYPNNYDNNEDCTYLISTLGPYRILLSFRGVTEEKYDFVTVYDGPTTSSKVLAHDSGILGTEMMTSSGNNLLVTFKSDKSNTYDGFSARFSSILLIK